MYIFFALELQKDVTNTLFVFLVSQGSESAFRLGWIERIGLFILFLYLFLLTVSQFTHSFRILSVKLQ